VAFTVSGNAAYRVHSLTDVWAWLSEMGGSANPPIPPVHELSSVFKQFWHRANLEPIVLLVILAQGSVIEDIKTETRKTFRKRFTHTVNGSASWVKSEPSLSGAVNGFLKILDGSSPDEDELRLAGEEFIKAARIFAISLNLHGDPNE